MCLVVVVEDYTRIQNSFRVKYLFYLLHEGICLLTPLFLHVRGHIAACTVLSLQRTVIFVYNKVCNVIHELAVFLHLAFSSKILVEHEVEVSLKCVSEDYCICIAVLLKNLSQIKHCICKLRYRETDVLNDGGCTCLSHSGNGRQSLFPNLPQNGLLFCILCKCVWQLGRDILYCCCNLLTFCIHCSIILCTYLHQQSCCTWRQRLYVLGYTGCILNRFYTCPVHHLYRRNRLLFKDLHSLASLLDCREYHKGQPLMRMLHNSIVGY